MTLRTLNYGNYGIFLIMGNAGFCPSAVLWVVVKIMVPFWVPNIVRHLFFRVPKKGGTPINLQPQT